MAMAFRRHRHFVCGILLRHYSGFDLNKRVTKKKISPQKAQKTQKRTGSVLLCLLCFLW
jgi:hypothetical protein